MVSIGVYSSVDEWNRLCSLVEHAGGTWVEWFEVLRNLLDIWVVSGGVGEGVKVGWPHAEDLNAVFGCRPEQRDDGLSPGWVDVVEADELFKVNADVEARRGCGDEQTDEDVERLLFGRHEKLSHTDREHRDFSGIWRFSVRRDLHETTQRSGRGWRRGRTTPIRVGCLDLFP